MATEDFLQMSSRFCENAESTEGSLSSVTEPSPIYVPSPSVETDVEAQVATDTTINQTGSYGDKTSENRRPIVSPERQFERCDNRACKTTMADCFKFDGQNCCVCPPAYYGGGAEGCWSIVPERPRRIYLDGQMQLNLEGPGRDPIVLFTFLDTEVKKDESILLQSGVHDVPQNFQSIHIMSPIFQFLNSFLAFPSQQCMNTDLMASRIFNVFSLASGFSTPFNFTFRLQVTDHGNLVVRGALLRQSSTEDTYRGSITIEVFPEGDFTPLTSTLVGTDGIFQSDEKHSRLIIYEKRCAGRLDFEPQVYTFKTGENKTVTVQVYGSGNALVEDGACILAENSLMAKGKKFFVKMDTQGYCREDCRSGSGCSFYCVDMPALYANTPGSCDCVICEQENEVCVPEGSSHSCKCKEGFKRNENGVCQEDRIQLRIDSVCQLHLDAGPCRGRMIRYGFDSQIGRCREFTYGGCLGNANNFETLAECEARCGTASSGAKSEDENDDVCQQPIIRGPCRASLSRFAYNPSTGNCEAFSYGGCRGNRNNFETKEECERRCLVAFANPCTTVRCGYNAHCVNGTCHCNEGYDGDARYECRPVYADRCADVRCGYNARCSDGVCVCEAGFEGDPYSHCRQIPDRCANVRCGYNARCSDGVCVCEDGFEGDPNIQCNRVADPCVNVRCGYNARCQNGTCYCEPGYDGDPNYECRLVGSG
uniref:EGF-like domain-containing protein n=1 Tax=Mesocestoides corti TaxID=53468 RepID=A0A5K3FU51_MESCO